MNEVQVFLSNNNSIIHEETNSKYIFDLNALHLGVSMTGMEITLEHIYFLNTYPTFNASNQNLYFKENGGPTIYNAVLISGYYDVDALETILKTELDRVGSNTYTVQYDSVRGTLSIDAGANTFQFVDGVNNAYTELGLVVPTTNAATTTGTSILDLSGPASMLIQMNLPSTSFSSNLRQIFTEVPISAPSLTWADYEVENLHYQFIIQSSMNNLSIELFDSRHQKPYYLSPNTEVRFRFKIRPPRSEK